MQVRTHITDCIGLLEQAAHLLAQIDDAVFATTTPISPRGSIGGHVRHILGFYQCFVTGIEDQTIDYNIRERNPLLEHERVVAVAEISTTITDLMQLNLPPSHAHLLVSTEESTEENQIWCRSSVLRELEFLKSHTIHHYSLIAMLLRLHEIDPGEEFGVAPSTLRHWQEEAVVCAR